MSEANSTSAPRSQEALVAVGDVTGLLDLLLRSPAPVDGHDLAAISRCVRRKATLNIDALGGDLFTVMLSIVGVLQLRCALYIGRELARSTDASSSDLIPQALADEWLPRFERLNRFAVEMLAMRSRTLHVRGLAGGSGIPGMNHDGLADLIPDRYGPDGSPLPKTIEIERLAAAAGKNGPRRCAPTSRASNGLCSPVR